MNEHANDARPKAKPKKTAAKGKVKSKGNNFALDTYQPSHRSRCGDDAQKLFHSNEQSCIPRTEPHFPLRQICFLKYDLTLPRSSRPRLRTEKLTKHTIMP